MVNFFKPLTGNETEEELKAYKEQVLTNGSFDYKIYLTVEAFSDHNFIKKLFSLFSSFNIKMIVGSSLDNRRQNCIFREDEIQYMKHSTTIAKQNNVKVDMFDEFMHESFEMDKVIETNEMLYEMVNKIRNATVNGQPLSLYEKFLFAYMEISKDKYKKADSDNFSSVSRHLVHAMTENEKVCVSYAARLTFVCNQLGIPCINQFCTGHQVCCVYMQDEKYGIDGMYISDPTSRKVAISSLMSPHLYHHIHQRNKHDPLKNYEIRFYEQTTNQEFANFYANLPPHARKDLREYNKYRSELESDIIMNQEEKLASAEMKVGYEFKGYFYDLVYECVNCSKKEAMKFINKESKKITEYFNFTDMDLFYDFLMNKIDLAKKQIERENKDISNEDLIYEICDKIVEDLPILEKEDKYVDKQLETIKYPPIEPKVILEALKNMYIAKNNGNVSEEKALWGANFMFEGSAITANYLPIESLLKRFHILYAETKDEIYLEIIELLQKIEDTIEQQETNEL